MYVQGMSNGVLAPGQQLTIWGGFFDDACQVLFNGVAGVIENVEDGSLVAVCPETLGDYTVDVKSGSTVVSAGSLRVVQLGETPLPARPKDYSLADLVSYVRGLFPRSAVLDFGTSSNFGKFINGMARAVQYMWGVIAGLFRDLDPAHTTSFDDWEAELGLPVDGIVADGFDERRSEIYRVACTKGGATKPYFLKILRLMGYEAEISEYYKEPGKFTVSTLEYTDNEGGTTSWQNKSYTYSFPAEADRNFYWQIRLKVPELKVGYADCETGTCDSFLVSWEDYAMENIINAIKPAHTVAIFIYDDGVRMGYLLDENGKRLTDENGVPLTYTNHLW